MTFRLFTIMTTPRLQEVHRGQEAGTHQSIGGGTSSSIWRQGHLDLQWLPLQRGQGPGWGWVCLPGCPPLSILCRSAPPVHHGGKLEM
jgi:hypothetical protein